MARILFLAHRLPYPPNKGDKVRSYHLLKHLAMHHEVFLGTFIDDPEDEQYIPTVKALCADFLAIPLNPRLARAESLKGVLTGKALTLEYYRNSGLKNWVDEVCNTQKIDGAVIFSSAMAQYIEDYPRLPTVIDFVDVDSAKWTAYAPHHRWPLSWLYRREGAKLLEYERYMAARVARSFFVTENEVDLFCKFAPECRIRVDSMSNGVDSDFFAVDNSRPSPYGMDELPLVFTGAMDYLPNTDAVVWFANEILPEIIKRQPKAKFYIVGRNPTPEVRSLEGQHIVVTGTVPDVRPYLQHAAIVVAPLRIARGIQNKILEAMAMERPVIATSTCAIPIAAEIGNELVTADTPSEYVEAVEALLRDSSRASSIGRAARSKILSSYSWEAHLKALDTYLPTASIPASAPSKS